jgi:hypothetical protein
MWNPTEWRIKPYGHLNKCKESQSSTSFLLGKRRTLHTKEAQERFLMSKSLVSRLAGREKMAQQLLAGLALSSIWEKARARDGQREVVGDKRQWSLICKGWDQLQEQGLGTGKGWWREIRDSELWSARDETSCWSKVNQLQLRLQKGQFLSDRKGKFKRSTVEHSY